jgi:hypothetical protein
VIGSGHCKVVDCTFGKQGSAVALLLKSRRQGGATCGPGGCSTSRHVCVMAAANGKLELLQCARSNGSS